MAKFFISLFLLSCWSAKAQESTPWTLEQCINYALDHNTTIQQNILQGEILQNNLTQSKWNRAPSLNGNGNHNYNIGRTIDPFTNSFNNSSVQSNSFSLSSNLLLYSGNRINNSVKQNKMAMNANDAGTAVVQNQIALSVANAYLQIIQAEENLKLAKSQHQITKNQLNQAQILYQSGATNQSNVLNLKAQASNDNVTIINAENAIQIGYNTLINLMQYPLDQPLEINTLLTLQEPSDILDDISIIYDLALDNRPEIRQAEALISQNKYAEKVAKAGLQPSLSAYGTINTLYSESGKEIRLGDTSLIPIGFTENSAETVLAPNIQPVYLDKSFGRQLNDNLGQQVGVTISVPILNGNRNRTTVKNARINTKISELNLQNAKNQLRNDITTAYTNLKNAKSRYIANKQNAKAQKLNYSFNQKRYDAGTINSTDLLTTKNQWNQAQIQLLNAKYEWIFRTLIIDFYIGKKLTLE